MDVKVYLPTVGSYDPMVLWIPSSQLVQEYIYTYDALGHRIQKQVINYSSGSNSTHRYAYDGQDILFETDGANNPLAFYTHSDLSADDVLEVTAQIAA